jgi:hypothetical protein
MPARTARGLGVAVLTCLLLVGCGKQYWNKTDAGPADFQRESMECARENAVLMGANKDYGIVIADLYKNCMKMRGWNRAQQFEPPPPGWFRGIEDDGPMRLQPAPSAAPTAAPQPVPAQPVPQPVPQPAPPQPGPSQPIPSQPTR